MSGCDPGSAQLREKTATRSSSVSSAENTSSLSVEVSVRLPNTDTLLDCDSSSTYGGFGDPILRICFIVHRVRRHHNIGFGTWGPTSEEKY